MGHRASVGRIASTRGTKEGDSMSETWISPCKSNRRGNIGISQVKEQGRREEEGKYSHFRILCKIVQRRERAFVLKGNELGLTRILPHLSHDD